MSRDTRKVKNVYCLIHPFFGETMKLGSSFNSPLLSDESYLKVREAGKTQKKLILSALERGEGCVILPFLYPSLYDTDHSYMDFHKGLHEMHMSEIKFYQQLAKRFPNQVFILNTPVQFDLIYGENKEEIAKEILDSLPFKISENGFLYRFGEYKGQCVLTHGNAIANLLEIDSENIITIDNATLSPEEYVWTSESMHFSIDYRETLENTIFDD